MAKGETKDMQRSGAGRGEAVRPARALSPFEGMDRMFDRWFENFFQPGGLRPYRMDWPETRIPKVDVIDRDDEVVMRAEVPGATKDDLDVSVSDNMVTIKGQTRREEKEERGDYYRREISQGAFARTIALPDNVDSGRAKAKFSDGVLELTLPKLEKSKRHTVKID